MSLRSVISGTGSYVPPTILTNHDLEQMVDTSDEWITTRTGIKRRHITRDGETNSYMAVRAARAALEQAGLEPEDISALVLPTVTPEYVFPATAQLVQAELGLKDALTFDLNAACSGFIYALNVADNLVRSGDHRHVLVIGSEVMTAITNWEDRSTCVLFGDAAAAVVLSAYQPRDGEPFGLGKFVVGSNGKLYKLLYQPAGGSLMPPSHKTVDQRLHSVHMHGNEVFKKAVRYLERVVSGVLEKNQRKPEDIRWYVPHQANRRIIMAVAERFGIPEERVYVNIHEYGNTTAASIPLCLDELNRQGKLEPGDELILFTFGAGFTWGGCHLVWGPGK